MSSFCLRAAKRQFPEESFINYQSVANIGLGLVELEADHHTAFSINSVENLPLGATKEVLEFQVHLVKASVGHFISVLPKG